MLPALAMPKITLAGAWVVIRFLLVVACVLMLVWAGKGVYADQVQIRDAVIEQTAQRAAAEARAGSLEVVVTQQRIRANEQARELVAARKAMEGLNTEFKALRQNQKRLQASISDVTRDLQSKPMPEVEAKANALMDEINKQMEEALP